MIRKKEFGFSLIELIVVIAIMAVLAGIILPVVMDLRTTSGLASQQRNIQLWNQIYSEACSAKQDLASVGDWNTISNDLAAGVTANVGDKAVTFACPKPPFINAGEPTFVPGKGITAAP